MLLLGLKKGREESEIRQTGWDCGLQTLNSLILWSCFKIVSSLGLTTEWSCGKKSSFAQIPFCHRNEFPTRGLDPLGRSWGLEFFICFRMGLWWNSTFLLFTFYFYNNFLWSMLRFSVEKLQIVMTAYCPVHFGDVVLDGFYMWLYKCCYAMNWVPPKFLW